MVIARKSEDMPDRYLSFKELRQNENAFVVEQTPVPNSTWLIAAPHGGNIESGTTEIALTISHACSSSYYSFIGKKEPDGGDLHLTSHRFDEPIALQLAASHRRLLCVHGILAENGEGAWLIPGGAYRQAHELLKQNLNGIVNLREETPLGKKYSGVHPKNICNRGSSGEGLQIELSSELRKQLLSNPDFLEAFSRNIADTLKNLD
jgi:phage replication-related protein YjqB (UPF0714/DUF867 family)